MRNRGAGKGRSGRLQLLVCLLLISMFFIYKLPGWMGIGIETSYGLRGVDEQIRKSTALNPSGGSPTSDRKVVIAGLFKNNGDSLEKMVNLMRDSVKHFKDYALLLIEDDSTDNTAKKLRKICSEDSHAICSNMIIKGEQIDHFLAPDRPEYIKSPFHPWRFAKMSFFRNSALDLAKKMRKFDYFIFADPDMYDQNWLPEKSEISGGLPHLKLSPWGGKGNAWDPKSILSSLERAEQQQLDFSAICFYGTFGKEFYNYDMLAFRLAQHTPITNLAKEWKPTWTYEDWNFRFSAKHILEQKSTDKELHYAMYLFNYHKTKSFVPVESCFGGLAIYDLNIIRQTGCSYDEQFPDCEHVALNNCFNEKRGMGTIYLDPQSKVFYDEQAYKAYKNL